MPSPTAHRWALPPLLWTVVKWCLFLLVSGFVAARARQLWREDTLEQLQVGPGWLVLAAGVYLVSWLPSAWFWRRLLVGAGAEVRSLDALRAYYCGHLGKYVPGKAMVVIIRSGLLKSRGVPAGTAALMTVCETLLMMAVGGVLAIAFSVPKVLDWMEIEAGWARRVAAVPGIALLLTVLILLAVSPVLTMLFRVLAAKLRPKVAEASLDSEGTGASKAGETGAAEKSTTSLREAREGDAAVTVTTSSVALALVLFAAAWAVQGLSLGLTLRGIDAAAFQWSDWPVWTAAVAGATVIGFVAVFAPAGVGVREGLLIETLRLDPSIGEKHAVAAAVLLRVVWIAAEIALAGVLYYLVRPPKEPERLQG